LNPRFISVVMPLYNNAADVERSIASVLSQTHRAFELLIVNDGSTDGGENRARAIDDSRVRVLDEEHGGVSAARNRGVKEATAPVVAFLDADDEWKPDFLETIARLCDSFPSCSVFATHYLYRETDGTMRTPILRNIPPGTWEGILENYFAVAASSDPPIWTSAVALEKEALASVGGFPDGIAIGEDLLTWARLAVRCRIAYSRRQCSVFRLRAPLVGYPTRRPEENDVVGKELQALLDHLRPDEKRAFRRYLGMWHRMRASMYVQLGENRAALREVKKMAFSVPGDPRVYLYGTLAILPRFLRNFILHFFTLVRTFRRTITR